LPQFGTTLSQKTRKIKKLLIANRGEIALRVMRACRELGIRTVAVFSEVDRNSLHVISADEAYALGGALPRESYLNQSRIVEIARSAAVDAIHPGYGFLAENPDFAQVVGQADIGFIGPSPDSIRQMGDKTQARKAAKRLGIPTVSGTLEPLKNAAQGLHEVGALGFPLLLKAAAGGGGKGMRVVRSASEFESAFRTAQSEAKSAFGDDRVYVEKYLDGPRHIEMQILADTLGNVVYLGERECSIQRRHQKVVEESPSVAVNAELRMELGNAAVKLAKEAGYSNAGTMEFLLDSDGKFYFLEMNTRLQVEHPVTEELTGIDLVVNQILVAEGEKLPIRQEDITHDGHAIECRICAEDPENAFMPSTGVLTHYDIPQGRIRIENGFRPGDEISVYYDSLLAKVISWGKTRQDAIAVMLRGLDEFKIHGVKSTIPFCRYVLEHKQFTEGQFNTSFIDKYFKPSELSQISEDEMIAAALTAAIISGRNGHNKQQRSLGIESSKWREAKTETYRP
jgi:acetyl-CoA carboxylase biotin carboxylase subunit